MISSYQRRLIAFTVALAFLPGLALAQTLPSPDAPFQSVEGRLKVGQTAEVVDNSGLTIRGKVTELSSSTLVLTGGFGTQRFGASDVMAIKRAGPIWDGAVKGAGIGLVAMALILRTDQFRCYTDCGGFYLPAAGIGAGIGVGIDALFGPRTVYGSGQAPARAVKLLPMLSRERKGVSAAITF